METYEEKKKRKRKREINKERKMAPRMDSNGSDHFLLERMRKV